MRISDWSSDVCSSDLYERDPIIGFDNRYTASAGIGYDYIRNDRMRLSLDAGPSFRHVKYTDDGIEDRAGIRSSLDFNWKLSPTLTLQQNASAYFEKDNSTLTSLTDRKSTRLNSSH